MLSSFTLQTAMKLASSAMVIATRLLSMRSAALLGASSAGIGSTSMTTPPLFGRPERSRAVALERARGTPRDLRLDRLGRRGLRSDPMLPTHVEHRRQPAHAVARVNAHGRVERDGEVGRLVHLQSL